MLAVVDRIAGLMPEHNEAYCRLVDPATQAAVDQRLAELETFLRTNPNATRAEFRGRVRRLVSEMMERAFPDPQPVVTRARWERHLRQCPIWNGDDPAATCECEWWGAMPDTKSYRE